MASMYALPAYVSGDASPVPEGNMYALPNYHQAIAGGSAMQNGIPNGTAELEMVDPVALLEKQQLELIASLTSLGDKLNTLLQQKGTKVQKSAAPVDKKTGKESAPAEKTPAAPAAADGAKKDKDAKKEARKAAKQEAKAKVASGEAPKGKPAKNGNGWIVKEDKRSTETGQSLTACTKPELASFSPQTAGDVTLTVTVDDLPWVKALAAVGEKKAVVFSGAVSNKVSKGSTTVNVVEGGKFDLKLKDGSVSSRVAAWKVLGSALGLFSFEANQTIQAAHQHQWLLKCESVVVKKATVDNVLRDASQFLSRFDTLGSQFNVGVADIVLRSLLSNHAQPNNIELWKNRVDSL